MSDLQTRRRPLLERARACSADPRAAAISSRIGVTSTAFSAAGGIVVRIAAGGIVVRIAAGGIFARIAAGASATTEDQIRLRLSYLSATEHAAQAVDPMRNAAGMNAVLAGSALERC
jgi:hypothetical protein